MSIKLALGVIFVGSVAAGLLRGNFGPVDKPIPIPDAAPGQSATAPRPVKDNVIAYHTGDEAMIGAKRQARATLPRFCKLIADGTRGAYIVKFPLTQNGETEHIWLQLDGGCGSEFVGRLANDPTTGSKYRKGDRMTVAAADVEDWMIRTPSAIYGGYTTRVALTQMPKDEQDKYRSMFRD